MARRTRIALTLTLLVLVPLAAACGGGEAEEPAPAPAEEPTPAEEPAPQEMPAEEPEPEAPAEPQLVGNIILSGEDFEWTSTGDNAGYRWQARVSNDTTATLNITVRFQFLDENDANVKTETKSVRLAPAQSSTVTGTGSMTWDEANQVVSFAADYDYSIVS